MIFSYLDDVATSNKRHRANGIFGHGVAVISLTVPSQSTPQAEVMFQVAPLDPVIGLVTVNWCRSARRWHRT